MQASYRRGSAVWILHPRRPMRALTVRPGTPHSGALASLPEVDPGPDEVLVRFSPWVSAPRTDDFKVVIELAR